MEIWTINSGFQIVNFGSGVNFIDPDGKIIGFSENKRVGLSHPIILAAIDTHNRLEQQTIETIQEQTTTQISSIFSNPLLLLGLIVVGVIILRK